MSGIVWRNLGGAFLFTLFRDGWGYATRIEKNTEVFSYWGKYYTAKTISGWCTGMKLKKRKQMKHASLRKLRKLAFLLPKIKKI